MSYVKCIEERKLWNNGYVQCWDFSKANTCQEAREEACALVSGACRDVTIKNKQKHYDRLITEHAGEPTEVLQFIPVAEKYNEEDLNSIGINNYWRFGYFGGFKFYTNLRNVMNYEIDNEVLNLSKELVGQTCSSFAVFKVKIPYMIVDHLRRHKLLSNMMAENWQSNRSKHEIEYFENREVSACTVDDGISSVKKALNMNPEGRKELINKGEFGLRYVTGWLAGWLQDPRAWENFFKVRTQNPTQKETQELANVIYEMVQKHYGI